MGRRYFGLAAAIVIGAAVSACVPMGGTDFPQASAGFTPRTTYPVSAARAYEAALAALNANAIPVVSASPATGQITTDYLAGKGQLVGLGLLSADHTRYKYAIFITPQGKGHAGITVSCSLEISQYTGETATPFHDVSGDNPDRVAALKNWLYEKIEQQLGQR